MLKGFPAPRKCVLALFHPSKRFLPSGVRSGNVEIRRPLAFGPGPEIVLEFMSAFLLLGFDERWTERAVSLAGILELPFSRHVGCLGELG